MFGGRAPLARACSCSSASSRATRRIWPGIRSVGPAGRVLDEALATAGIERRETYVTNAVKHFKWLSRGKCRCTKLASAREIAACRPWLEAEIESLAPSLIVCLGATASRSADRPPVSHYARAGPDNGQRLVRWIMATYHPSAVLCLAPTTRHRMRCGELADDLRQAAQRVELRMVCASHGGAE